MLNFSRAQRNGLIVLSVLIILSLLFPLGIKYFKKQYKTSFSEFEKAIGNAEIQKKKEYSHTQNIGEDSLFVFDPNLASQEELQKLHLSNIQIKQILNYRKKKGKFYLPEDLKKIYAIDDSTYHRLEKYISIQRNIYKSNKNHKKYQKAKYKTKKYKKVIVEINSANQSELQKIRGIGSSLSARIVKYRDALGGFVNQVQIKEVYGIDEEKYKEISEQLKCNNQLVHKIRINFSTAKELEKHPYFSKKQAKEIIKYRSFRGRFSSIQDLKKKLNYKNDFIHKISPYLEF